MNRGSKFPSIHRQCLLHSQLVNLLSLLMAAKKFESEIQLVCMCEFDLRGRSASGYLLKDRDNNYCVRFGFTTEGTHPFLSQTEMELNMESWHKGIVGFPLGETLRIHMRSRPDYTERVMQLEALADKTNLPTLQLLDYAEQRQTKNLTLFGKRRSYEIDLFATYTYAPGKSADQDNLERILGWLGNKYDTLKGQRRAKVKSALSEILLQAFTEGFLHWEEQLNTRMELKIIPMSASRSYNYSNPESYMKIEELRICLNIDVVKELSIGNKSSERFHPKQSRRTRTKTGISSSNGAPEVFLL